MLVNTQLRFPSTDRTYIVRLPTEALSNKVIGIVRIPSTSWDILSPNVAEILIRYSVCAYSVFHFRGNAKPKLFSVYRLHLQFPSDPSSF